MLRYMALCCVAVVFYGCAAKVNTSVLIPAREGEVLKYHTVAVFPFGDSSWNDYSTMFESAIASASVDGKKVYTLVDRQQMNKIMSEQQFQMTMANPDSMVAMGRLLGIQAFWVGNTSNEYGESYYSESRTKCDKEGKNCYNYSVSCSRKTLNFTATPRLISVSSAGVVYSKSINHMITKGVCSDSGYTVNVNEMKSQAMQKVLAEFIKDIAPYTVNVTLEFMDKDKDIYDEASKKMLKDGIAFAKEDRFERACETWADALARSPKAVSLNYNTAICYEVKGDYAKAVEVLTFAERNMPPGGGSTVKEALDRNRKNLDNATKTKEQLGK